MAIIYRDKNDNQQKSFSGALLAIKDDAGKFHLFRAASELTVISPVSVQAGGNVTASLTLPAEFSGKEVIWSIADGSRARFLSASGSTGVGGAGASIAVYGLTEGSTTITATVAGVSFSATLTVTAAGGGSDPVPGGGTSATASIQTSDGQKALSVTLQGDGFDAEPKCVDVKWTGGRAPSGLQINHYRFSKSGGSWVMNGFAVGTNTATGYVTAATPTFTFSGSGYLQLEIPVFSATGGGSLFEPIYAGFGTEKGEYLVTVSSEPSSENF